MIVYLEDLLVVYSNFTYIIGSQTGQGPQKTSNGAHNNWQLFKLI